MTNPHKGSTFDNFLEEEHLSDEVEAVAIKRVIAYQIEESMRQRHLSKTAMAEKMHTSRSALDRLLDPLNTAVTLQTLIRAAHAVGKTFEFSLSQQAGN